MSWLSFAIGLVLIGAGAVAIAMGAPVIQLERGWAEVISGSVLLAGGCITLALAGVLWRLSAIQRLILVERDRPPVIEAALPPVAVAPVTPPPVEPAPIEVPEADTPIETEHAPRHGLWKRVRRDARSEPVVGIAGTPVLAEDLEPVVAVPPRPESPTIPESAPVSDATAGLVETEGHRPGPDEEPMTMRPSLAAEHDEAEPRGDGDGLSSEAEAPAPAEPAGARTIVGRYQAGSASYVMYSDGTIDVMTEGETVRSFASMNDLKAYIHEQEAAGSPRG